MIFRGMAAPFLQGENGNRRDQQLCLFGRIFFWQKFKNRPTVL